jgi:hypothetical protein
VRERLAAFLETPCAHLGHDARRAIVTHPRRPSSVPRNEFEASEVAIVSYHPSARPMPSWHTDDRERAARQTSERDRSSGRVAAPGKCERLRPVNATDFYVLRLDTHCRLIRSSPSSGVLQPSSASSPESTAPISSCWWTRAAAHQAATIPLSKPRSPKIAANSCSAFARMPRSQRPWPANCKSNVTRRAMVASSTSRRSPMRPSSIWACRHTTCPDAANGPRPRARAAARPGIACRRKSDASAMDVVDRERILLDLASPAHPARAPQHLLPRSPENGRRRPHPWPDYYPTSIPMAC